jgi:hypothetical protein
MSIKDEFIFKPICIGLFIRAILLTKNSCDNHSSFVSGKPLGCFALKGRWPSSARILLIFLCL